MGFLYNAIRAILAVGGFISALGPKPCASHAAQATARRQPKYIGRARPSGQAGRFPAKRVLSTAIYRRAGRIYKNTFQRLGKCPAQRAPVPWRRFSSLFAPLPAVEERRCPTQKAVCADAWPAARGEVSLQAADAAGLGGCMGMHFNQGADKACRHENCPWCNEIDNVFFFLHHLHLLSVATCVHVSPVPLDASLLPRLAGFLNALPACPLCQHPVFKGCACAPQRAPVPWRRFQAFGPSACRLGKGNPPRGGAVRQRGG